ncbi:FkbM family methyltransferase [Acuticoccus sp. I52.16.1]|uniref:FkbM family methyltransferase n=1 Tax=Acuticoccus sp. I52.16.1 TaxID=2928472 RepID=UPI001FD4FB2F|nr:FkbM family methyltransferase [Acuticoccus sp. I52.16.1]UOM33967.1 FkbM family methyltransferase [Acuticoccus sp. I52.16.1]
MTVLDRDAVVGVFEAMLGRPPENESVVEQFRATPSVAELVGILAQSGEFQGRLGAPVAPSPFVFYNKVFDGEALVMRHVDPARGPAEGMRVNSFGVKVPEKVIPRAIVAQVPPVEASPIPSNWHADTAEFAAALRAVELAGETFTMLELGCGWGCWMNITGVVGRRAGKRVRLVGVEGDRFNFGLAEETLAANGFTAEDFTLHHGIAHAQSGTAAFPQQQAGEDTWGLAPVFSTDPDAYAAAIETGRYTELPMIAFDALAAEHGRFDLVHIDIQGGERDLVAAGIEALTRTAAYVVIGTHSREIEGAVMETFAAAGWTLEVERPAILSVPTREVTVDGVQGWRNPRLV